MNLLNDPYLIGILIVLGITVLGYLSIIKKDVFGFSAEGMANEALNHENQVDNSLAGIFYLYNHKSERDWLQWVETQPQDVKQEAFRLLAEHLNGPSKFWGYITLEVLNVMHAFKELKSAEVVGRFTQEVGKLWGEYKSIPNYYQKAIHSLISIDPLYSMRILNAELDKNNSNSEFCHDKKKIILDALPKLKELGVGMMIAILNHSEESFAIKSHGLRVATSFPDENYQQILLETIKKQTGRIATANKEIRAEDSQLLQDILKEGIQYIGQPTFLKVIKKACDFHQLQPYIINPLIQKLREEKTLLNPTEIYAMTLLKDNESGELNKAICGLHNLEELEINHICALPTITPLDEDSLKNIDIQASTIFIPHIFKPQYDDFKALFFQSHNSNPEEACEKNYGGVIITGDDKLEKLYFSKAFAKEKKFNFAYINLQDITSKETYNSVCSIFSRLRKPYLLFIDNPELMFPLEKSDLSVYREKFAQTLHIQSLDAKSLLVGSMNQPMKAIEVDNARYSLTKLRKKFFSQALEMNKKEERFKVNIIENFLSFISSYRFENRSELIHELIELGKGEALVKFTFFVIETLSIMLMVYGKDMPYSEIKKLQNKFIDTPGKGASNDDDMMLEEYEALDED